MVSYLLLSGLYEGNFSLLDFSLRLQPLICQQDNLSTRLYGLTFP